MSIHLGAGIAVIWFVVGVVITEMFGLGSTTGLVLSGSLAIVMPLVMIRVFNIPLAWGFGASNGPGTSPPKWVHDEKGVGIYEDDDGWRCVHYPTGMEVTAESPQRANDKMSDKLKSHGWTE